MEVGQELQSEARAAARRQKATSMKSRSPRPFYTALETRQLARALRQSCIVIWLLETTKVTWPAMPWASCQDSNTENFNWPAVHRQLVILSKKNMFRILLSGICVVSAVIQQGRMSSSNILEQVQKNSTRRKNPYKSVWVL